MSTAKTKTSTHSRRRLTRPPSSHRKASDRLPHFEPFVNPIAGPAATGVRIGFPAERTVSLNYAESLAPTASGGSFGKYQFRLNSPFDPDFTSTGHQPMGFDEWSLFYNHYVVEACTYEVVVISDFPLYVMTHISDDSTIPTAISTLTELGATTAIYVPGSAPHVFRGSVNMAQFFNRSDIAADSDLRASVLVNPIEQAYLSLIFGTALGTADTMKLIASVKLCMRVRFMEPKDLSPSTQSKHKPTTSNPSHQRPVAATPSVQYPTEEYEYVRVKRIE